MQTRLLYSVEEHFRSDFLETDFPTLPFLNVKEDAILDLAQL
jgi:hypothetical protein